MTGLSVYSCTNENKISCTVCYSYLLAKWGGKDAHKSTEGISERDGGAAKRVERNGGGRRMIEITMARQHARAGTHNGRARGTVKAVSTVNRGRGDPVVKGGRPWRRHSDRERDRFALHPRFQGMIFMFAYSSMSTVNYLVVESCKKKTITIPICHVPSRSYVRPLSRVWVEGGRRREGKFVEEIPGDRKPGRCLWGPRRRPLSVNGAESSPSGRGGRWMPGAY